MSEQPREQVPEEPYEGIVTLEWFTLPGGGSPRPLPGCPLVVSDAETGETWTTITDVVIHAPVRGLVTAELTMFADRDGRPICGNKPPVIGSGGRALLGTFRFLVAGLGTQRKVTV